MIKMIKSAQHCFDHLALVIGRLAAGMANAEWRISNWKDAGHTGGRGVSGTRRVAGFEI
jgi:hypothetical protein